MKQVTYEQGLEILNQYVKTPQIITHSKEVAAIMEHLAKKLGEPVEEWKVAGLLHDLDYDVEKDHMERHARTAVKILEKKGLGSEALHAILAHNEDNTGIKRETDMDYALAASDNMAGLVRATALVYPDKKVASVKPRSVTKRFKSPSFAAGANREMISGCTNIGLTLEEFAEVSVEAIRSIADEVGL